MGTRPRSRQFCTAQRRIAGLEHTNEGTINAFDGINGNFIGTVKDTTGNVIRIDQLWAIDFGGGTSADGSLNQLLFTAGPANNLAGTFEVIVPK